MNKAEIIVVILISLILLFVAITYFFHGRKIEKKNKADKQKAKTEEIKKEEAKQESEQKPVPVGIIKEEKPKSSELSSKDYDLAPFKEQPAKQETILETKNLKQEIKDLSPEMKKVLMSDLLKPKF